MQYFETYAERELVVDICVIHAYDALSSDVSKINEILTEGLRGVIHLSMYVLEIYDGKDRGIIALRRPQSLAEVARMVQDTANEFPMARQWSLLCQGKFHSVWERKLGSRKYPKLTSSIIGSYD